MGLSRNNCVLTGESDLEHLHTFDDFPIFMGCTEAPESDDLRAPMSWWISQSTGMIQLKDLIPLIVLYPESHGAGEVGALWRRHHSEFADFVSGFNPRSVFDIGGAHGILEAEHRKHREIPWTILDPNPHPSPETRAGFIKGYFDEDYVFGGDFDAVVHSHLFEHIYHPVDFMRALSKFIPEGANLAFSVPNMEEMLKRKYTNCINFEHTILLTEPYVDYLLANNGFEVVNKRKFQDDHSLFFHAILNSDVKAVNLPGGLYHKYKQLFNDFMDYHTELVADLNKRIESLVTPTYLFGAHIFTQYLIAFGLDTSNLAGILDNDPSKQGKRLYGTTLQVHSPKVLSGEGKTNIILKAGVYSKEIQNDIEDNYNQECNFIT
jgi:hypothetical protein